MAAPVCVDGTPGNLINGLSVAHGAAAIAAYLDLSAKVQGDVTCETIVGASLPTSVTTFSAYKVYGNATPITLSAGVSAAATSLSVSSKTGLSVGQSIQLQHAGAIPQVGEVAVVSSLPGSGPPYSVILTTGTINGYSSGDTVYLIAQTASFVAAPSNAAGAYTINTDFSSMMSLPPGRWAVAVKNGDGAANVTSNATVDWIDHFA